VTLDGINYFVETTHTIFGAYYFLSTEKIDHLRIAMSWFTVGAEVGGLAEVLFILLTPLAIWYND